MIGGPTGAWQRVLKMQKLRIPESWFGSKINIKDNKGIDVSSSMS